MSLDSHVKLMQNCLRKVASLWTYFTLVMEHTPPSSVDLTLDLAAFHYREPLVFRTLRHYYQHHLYHIYIYIERFYNYIFQILWTISPVLQNEILRSIGREDHGWWCHSVVFVVGKNRGVFVRHRYEFLGLKTSKRHRFNASEWVATEPFFREIHLSNQNIWWFKWFSWDFDVKSIYLRIVPKGCIMQLTEINWPSRFQTLPPGGGGI